MNYKRRGWNLRLQLTFQVRRPLFALKFDVLSSQHWSRVRFERQNWVEPSFPIIKTYFQILPYKTIVRLFITVITQKLDKIPHNYKKKNHKDSQQKRCKAVIDQPQRKIRILTSTAQVESLLSTPTLSLYLPVDGFSRESGYALFRLAYFKVSMKAVCSTVEFWLAARDVCIFNFRFSLRILFIAIARYIIWPSGKWYSFALSRQCVIIALSKKKMETGGEFWDFLIPRMNVFFV